MDAAARDAYLTRLGVDAAPPSVDGLFELHRAQVEHVPYETVWIHMGDAWDIDVNHTVERVARGGRGGYCYHLNGAFSELLAALGYEVTRHVGGVHGPDGPSGEEMPNHLVLSVSGLPSDDHPSGEWYVDVGLGDALHEPLPLRAGTYVQEPFTLRLDEATNGIGDWHLTHDPRGSFPGMSWWSAPATMDAFTDRHRFLSTDPKSGFVKVLAVQRREADRVHILRGLTFSRVGNVAMQRDIESRDDLVDTLADVLLLDVRALEGPRVDALWSHLATSHEAWIAAGRP
jgi:N-hydroxyarylamine O-acetyltransferase